MIGERNKSKIGGRRRDDRNNKYIVFSLLGIIVFVGIYNQVENKPFKFENFENGEEVKKYLNKYYPVGSDVEILFRDLKINLLR